MLDDMIERKGWDMLLMAARYVAASRSMDWHAAREYEKMTVQAGYEYTYLQSQVGFP